jgi:hypothetical protein
LKQGYNLIKRDKTSRRRGCRQQVLTTARPLICGTSDVVSVSLCGPAWLRKCAGQARRQLARNIRTQLGIVDKLRRSGHLFAGTSDRAALRYKTE